MFLPFQRRARITVTNEGQEPARSFYFNIDCRLYRTPLPADTLYFHAQYRQAAPAKGWTSECKRNGDANVDKKTNLKGEDNYVWLEASGRGHFVGVTMSVLQNQDFWWGEGDDMFFIDGEMAPSIVGTGSEDYFLGAWDFGDRPFSYGLFGAPVKGEERAGSRSSVYRFHLDSPIPFTRSLRATIEHGHANHRSDNFFRRLLVPDRAARRGPAAADGRSPAAAPLPGRRPREHDQITRPVPGRGLVPSIAAPGQRGHSNASPQRAHRNC